MLHRPVENMEEYTSFCQPLISTLPADARQITLTDQASWKQHMIQLTHQSEQAAALALAAAGGGRGSGKAKRSNRSARGGTKRKRELVLQSQTSSVSASSDGGGGRTSGTDSINNDDGDTGNNENEGDQMVWTLEEMLEKQREDNEKATVNSDNTSSTISPCGISLVLRISNIHKYNISKLSPF